jgi:hypothetical protein
MFSVSHRSAYLYATNVLGQTLFLLDASCPTQNLQDQAFALDICFEGKFYSF